MGMDVVGRNAVDASGEYFRASVWSWRPLHELIRKLCGDLLDEECLGDMKFNCGAGPQDSNVCKSMSERFRKWLSSWDDDTYFLENEPTEATPEMLVQSLLEHALEKECPGMEIVPTSDYWVDREMLEDWTTFLDRCGGFEVW